MNSVTLSTKYSKSIRVKNKTFILYLRMPGIIEVYGPGISGDIPMVLTPDSIGKSDPTVFTYTDEEFWDLLKSYKKAMRKALKGIY